MRPKGPQWRTTSRPRPTQLERQQCTKAAVIATEEPGAAPACRNLSGPGLHSPDSTARQKKLGFMQINNAIHVTLCQIPKTDLLGYKTSSKIEIKDFILKSHRFNSPMAANQRGSSIFTLLHAARADELVTNILSHLDHPRSLVICSEVCKHWRVLIWQDVPWRKFCDGLWKDKAHIPREYRAMRESGRSREAFAQSLLDGKRLAITADELVDTVFYFRFKRSAGSYWTDKDPFWTANQPMRVSFGRDGSVSGFRGTLWTRQVMRVRAVDYSGEYMSPGWQ